MNAIVSPRLSSLRVRHLRNLRELVWDLSGTAQQLVISGPNGVGKTTLLEALYLLSRGRSFRGRKAGPLIMDGAERMSIEGRFQGVEGDQETILAFEWSGFEGIRRWNGRPVTRLSPFENPIRFKLVGENPQGLLAGDPTLRRTFLDWNVFHVEPQFGRVRSEFRRVLDQRNAWLRNGSRESCVWDPIFVDLAQQVHQARSDFLVAWQAAFAEAAKPFAFLAQCALSYSAGWSVESTLDEALRATRATERHRRQTLIGPQRADWSIQQNARLMRFSRGQAKVAVCVLQIAAEQVHRAGGLSPCLWLLDDLHAELDVETRTRIEQLYRMQEAQCFWTHVRGDHLRAAEGSSGQSTPMFHVEHPRTSQRACV
ncbi:hypothetical protein CKO25_10230 [Thiocapsa imhoffii]|uniref:DNA replication and repair protein RecF n=1 Tax=Thiocapsa imhoffii TaxID=382777 RepID=A0A9X1B9G8_9GAMM|nr:DNA replication and repair protein RecF [Thiocapsa imhoffii]MBK1645021.1 hypothetical protein [Thiocapsa imhoffii]